MTVEQCDKEYIFSKFYELGLESLSSRTSFFQDLKIKEIALSKFFIDISGEKLLEGPHLGYICVSAVRAGINLFKHESWKNILDKKYRRTLLDSKEMQYQLNTSDSFLDYCIQYKNDIDWKELFDKMYPAVTKIQYCPNVFVRCISKLFSSNIILAKFTIESLLFDSKNKPHSNIRICFYDQYIKNGLLTPKIARKIRSETSENVSSTCISSMFNTFENNPELYKDKESLILQFTDYKHFYGQQIIVKNAPLSMLYSFVAFDNIHVKKIIEKRMQDGV